ncbi:MAG TPA: lysophospholipid acyltransferase family protein [Gemmataceae bacterium]|nr:lysophospholipid acyltransferase family protein [Gemmataceae bacterium]
MKIRNPLLLRIIAFLLAWMVRIWIATLRYNGFAICGRVHPVDHHKEKFLYAFWHESLMIPCMFRTKIHVLISHHMDGELITRVCQHLGGDVVRGSSSRGGGSALVEMAKASEFTHLLINPDGPRGPRREVQVGLVMLASRTGLPIILVGVGYSRCWRLKSWDRFAIPKPFSNVYVFAHPPIAVPPDLSYDELREWRDKIEATFLRVTEQAEQWAATGKVVKEANRQPTDEHGLERMNTDQRLEPVKSPD